MEGHGKDEMRRERRGKRGHKQERGEEDNRKIKREKGGAGRWNTN